MIAMVVACLPCPPVSLLGSVLGLMSIGRIRQANGALRGTKLAKISIIVGILMSVSSLLLLTSLRDYLEQGQEKAISESVHVFLTQSVNENATGALSHWELKESPVSVEEIEAYGALVHERLGELQSIQIGKVVPSKDVSFLQPQLDAWLILKFEAGTRNASCQFILIPQLEDMTFGTKIISLRIEDPEGLISLPAEPELEPDDTPVDPEVTDAEAEPA